MKIYNKIFICLSVLGGLSIFNQAYAVSCTWKQGSEANPSVEIGTATNLVGVNNGIYPSPVNFALANITTAPYGGNAPGWGIICTKPIIVTPQLYMVRNPDTRFPNYPYLQDTNKTPFYSIEMSYTTPTGNKVHFGQVAAGQIVNVPSFVLAENATPTNPVEINLRSLNINSTTLQGYQVDTATRASTVWGTGGTLNDIIFTFADRDAPTVNPLRVDVRFFIYEIAFAVKTCAIDSNDLNKTVNLGDKAERDFSTTNVGGISNATPFRIGLRCEAGAAVTYRVNATADTTADPTNTLGLIKLNGTDAATGYALQLRSAPFKSTNLTPVKFNTAVSSSNNASGNSNDIIEFDASYYRTLPLEQSRPGTANATMTIDVNYQ